MREIRGEMSKIDRAYVRRGEGDFPDTAVIVTQQPCTEPLEREAVKLRRILWVLIVGHTLVLLVAAYSAFCAQEASTNAERAALYVQARPIQQEAPR